MPTTFRIAIPWRGLTSVRSGWNTLRTGGGIPDDELLEAIERSYELVVAELPKTFRGPDLA